MRRGIAVLDFGGQYAHLIANRVRRLQVYSEILRPTADVTALEGAVGLILSGGPASVYDTDRPQWNPELLGTGIPVLGLCYGHHLLAQELGGRVVPGTVREFGTARVRIAEHGELFRGLDAEEAVWMSHGDTVAELPEGFRLLGDTPECPAAAVGDPQRRIYGLQFHPEVAHTPRGTAIFENFVRICQAPHNWRMSDYAEHAIETIRDQAGDRNVFMLVSGGVDSSVAFVLLDRALGADRVQGLHIDTGFMRKDETSLVEGFLKREGFENLLVEDASDDFLLSVEGVYDPEEKRNAIGRTFLEVKDRVLERLGLDQEHWILGQGTLYPDTIESGGTEHAARIKTHHNRIDLIDELIAQGKVIEPLAELYKDEVRELGTRLGLPDPLVWRHPFPGPGLAVRCLCSEGRYREEDLAGAEARASEIARAAGLHLRLLPIRSVGVQGDYRTYAHPVVVWGDSDWSALEDVSTRITNSIRDINRVTYLLAPGELPELHLKRAFLTRPRLDLLREADALAMDALERTGLMQEVSQMPTVLVPMTTDGHQETVVLRPICTPDFMTARFMQHPQDLLDPLAEEILALDGVDAVLYDVTHKPPGTVEWE